MPTKARLFIRHIASVLVVTFLCQELSAAEPVRALPAVNPISLAAITRDPCSFEAPLEFSGLRDIHKGSGDTLIIHIQDAHANLSGQRNLAATLDAIMKKYGGGTPLQVLVEGGANDCSLTPLKKIATPDVWKRVANNFLIQGKISGEEYLNLTSDHPMRIMGIEDMDLYRKSVENYGKLAEKREEILDYLKLIQASLEKLKKRYYPKELVEYEREFVIARPTKWAEAIPQYSQPNSEYHGIASLATLARNDVNLLKDFPVFRQFQALQQSENNIDFKLANLEQTALVEQIYQKGGKEDLETHLTKIRQSSDNRLSQYTLFQNTLNIAQAKGIDVSQYPNLVLYGEYLRVFSQLDLDKLLDEQEKLEDRVYVKTLRNRDALLIRCIDRYLRLLVTAYSIQMTTKEFNLFKVNEPDFATPSYLAFINRKLAEQKYFENLIPHKDILDEGKKALEEFYGSVAQRDEAFMRNTETILSHEKSKVVVLISGGYHTPHLKKLFREKGYSYIVLTPIVTAKTNQSKYEKLLLEQLRNKRRARFSPPRSSADFNAPKSKVRPEATAMAAGRLAELATAASHPGETEKALKIANGIYERTVLLPTPAPTRLAQAPGRGSEAGARLAASLTTNNQPPKKRWFRQMGLRTLLGILAVFTVTVGAGYVGYWRDWEGLSLGGRMQRSRHRAAFYRFLTSPHMPGWLNKKLMDYQMLEGMSQNAFQTHMVVQRLTARIPSLHEQDIESFERINEDRESVTVIRLRDKRTFYFDPAKEAFKDELVAKKIIEKYSVKPEDIQIITAKFTALNNQKGIFTAAFLFRGELKLVDLDFFTLEEKSPDDFELLEQISAFGNASVGRKGPVVVIDERVSYRARMWTVYVDTSTGEILFEPKVGFVSGPGGTGTALKTKRVDAKDPNYRTVLEEARQKVEALEKAVHAKPDSPEKRRDLERLRAIIGLFDAVSKGGARMAENAPSSNTKRTRLLLSLEQIGEKIQGLGGQTDAGNVRNELGRLDADPVGREKLLVAIGKHSLALVTSRNTDQHARAFLSNVMRYGSDAQVGAVVAELERLGPTGEEFVQTEMANLLLSIRRDPTEEKIHEIVVILMKTGKKDPWIGPVVGILRDFLHNENDQIRLSVVNSMENLAPVIPTGDIATKRTIVESLREIVRVDKDNRLVSKAYYILTTSRRQTLDVDARQQIAIIMDVDAHMGKVNRRSNEALYIEVGKILVGFYAKFLEKGDYNTLIKPINTINRELSSIETESVWSWNPRVMWTNWNARQKISRSALKQLLNEKATIYDYRVPEKIVKIFHESERIKQELLRVVAIGPIADRLGIILQILGALHTRTETYLKSDSSASGSGAARMATKEGPYAYSMNIREAHLGHRLTQLSLNQEMGKPDEFEIVQGAVDVQPVEGGNHLRIVARQKGYGEPWLEVTDLATKSSTPPHFIPYDFTSSQIAFSGRVMAVKANQKAYFYDLGDPQGVKKLEVAERPQLNQKYHDLNARISKVFQIKPGPEAETFEIDTFDGALLDMRLLFGKMVEDRTIWTRPVPEASKQTKQTEPVGARMAEELFAHKPGEAGEKRFSLRDIVYSELGDPKSMKERIRYLDFGSGTGGFVVKMSRYLKEILKFEKVTGIGIEEDLTLIPKMDRGVKPGENFVFSDIHELLRQDMRSIAPQLSGEFLPKSFDLIFMNAPAILFRSFGAEPMPLSDWLNTADHYLKDDGIILIRLFEPSAPDVHYQQWMTRESRVLKRELRMGKKWTFKEFTKKTNPNFPRGHTPVGPLILVKKSKSPFKNGYSEISLMSTRRESARLAADKFDNAAFVKSMVPIFKELMSGQRRIVASDLVKFNLLGVPDLSYFPRDSQGRNRPFTRSEIIETMEILAQAIGVQDDAKIQAHQEQLRKFLSDSSGFSGDPYFVQYFLNWLLVFAPATRTEIARYYPDYRVISIARDGLILNLVDYFDYRRAHKNGSNSLYFPNGAIFQNQINGSSSDDYYKWMLTHGTVEDQAQQILIDLQHEIPMSLPPRERNAIIFQRFIERFNKWVDKKPIRAEFLQKFLGRQISKLSIKKEEKLLLFDTLALGKTTLIVAACLKRQFPDISVTLLLAYTKGDSANKLAGIDDLYHIKPKMSELFEPVWPVELFGIDQKSTEPVFAMTDIGEENGPTPAERILGWALLLMSAYNRAMIGQENDILGKIEKGEASQPKLFDQFVRSDLINQYLYPNGSGSLPAARLAADVRRKMAKGFQHAIGTNLNPITGYPQMIRLMVELKRPERIGPYFSLIDEAIGKLERFSEDFDVNSQTNFFIPKGEPDIIVTRNVPSYEDKEKDAAEILSRDALSQEFSFREIHLALQGAVSSLKEIVLGLRAAAASQDLNRIRGLMKDFHHVQSRLEMFQLLFKNNQLDASSQEVMSIAINILRKTPGIGEDYRRAKPPMQSLIGEMVRSRDPDLWVEFEKGVRFPNPNELKLLTQHGSAWRVTDNQNRGWYLKTDSLKTPFLSEEKFGYLLAQLMHVNVPAWTEVPITEIPKPADEMMTKEWLAYLRERGWDQNNMNRATALLTRDVNEMSEEELAQKESSGVEETLVFLAFTGSVDFGWKKNMAERPINGIPRWILFDMGSAHLMSLAQNPRLIDPRLVLRALDGGLVDNNRLSSVINGVRSIDLNEFEEIAKEAGYSQTIPKGDLLNRQKVLKDTVTKSFENAKSLKPFFPEIPVDSSTPGTRLGEMQNINMVAIPSETEEPAYRFSEVYGARLAGDGVKPGQIADIQNNSNTLEILSAVRLANPRTQKTFDLLLPEVNATASVKFIGNAGSRLAELRNPIGGIVGVIDFAKVEQGARLSVSDRILAAENASLETFRSYLSGENASPVVLSTPVTVTTILDGEGKIGEAQKALALAARLAIASMLKKQAEATGQAYEGLVRFQFLDKNGRELGFSDAGADKPGRRRIVISTADPARIQMAMEKQAGFFGEQAPSGDGRQNFVPFLSVYIAAILIATAPDGQENAPLVQILERLTGRTVPSGLVKILQEVKNPTDQRYQDYVAQALEKLSVDEYLEVAQFVAESIGAAA